MRGGPADRTFLSTERDEGRQHTTSSKSLKHPSRPRTPRPLSTATRSLARSAAGWSPARSAAPSPTLAPFPRRQPPKEPRGPPGKPEQPTRTTVYLVRRAEKSGPAPRRQTRTRTKSRVRARLWACLYVWTKWWAVLREGRYPGSAFGLELSEKADRGLNQCSWVERRRSCKREDTAGQVSVGLLW